MLRHLYSPGRDEDDRALDKKCVGEHLPVSDPLEQPGLVDAADGEADGHAKVANEGAHVNGDVLNG